MVKVTAIDLTNIPGVKKTAMPKTLAPMLATLIEKPFTDPDWYFEPKLDGYRILGFAHAGRVELQSRNFQDYTERFPAVAEELSAQPVDEAIFDGELVALDEKGKACFQCLQQHLLLQRGAIESTLIYYVFDLLYLNGYDLTSVSQSERASLLGKVLKPGRTVKLISRFEGNGTEIFTAAIKAGFEGVIAKRRDGHYQQGKRSTDWLKIKGTLADEFVIAGYTAGQGARSGAFGSLVLGQYGKNSEQLIYAGNVGTGFDERLLDDLKNRMGKLVTSESPFGTKIPGETTTTWLKPKLVAEVKYAERTRDGILRQPVFLRLREDKPAKEVHPQKIIA